jgi:hypothetical protein
LRANVFAVEATLAVHVDAQGAAVSIGAATRNGNRDARAAPRAGTREPLRRDETSCKFPASSKCGALIRATRIAAKIQRRAHGRVLSMRIS